jgi:hypothetical protein
MIESESDRIWKIFQIDRLFILRKIEKNLKEKIKNILS